MVEWLHQASIFSWSMLGNFASLCLAIFLGKLTYEFLKAKIQ